MEYYKITSELTHHGVKGMKWGVRRYQNKDGSLTNAGKKKVESSGGLYFPAYDRKRKRWKGKVTNRLAVSNTPDPDYDKAINNERKRIMNDKQVLKKAGYKFVDNPDSDVREHNSDIVQKLLHESPIVKEARKKNLERYINLYADATIADLELRNTERTKQYVKDYLGKIAKNTKLDN